MSPPVLSHASTPPPRAHTSYSKAPDGPFLGPSKAAFCPGPPFQDCSSPRSWEGAGRAPQPVFCQPPQGPGHPALTSGPLFGVITRRQLDLGSLAPSNRWALRSQNPSERETPAELPGGGSDEARTRLDPRKTGPGQGGCEADCCDNPPGSGVTEAQRRKTTHSPAPRSNVEEFRDLQSREGGRRVTMQETSLGQSRTFLGQSPWGQRRGCNQVGTILGNLEAQGVSWGQGSSQVAT